MMAMRQSGICVLIRSSASGSAVGDLFFSNYTDRVAGAGFGDFDGGNATYDGHRGIDSNILTWDHQDAGIPVFAALDGTVSSINDGEDDRNTVWNGQAANYVTINHDDGHLTSYY